MAINSFSTSGPQVSISARSKNIVVEIVFILIIMAVGYPYLIKPKQAEVRAKEAALHVLKQDSEEFEETTKALQNLQLQLTSPENEVALQVLDEALPLSSRITRSYMEIQDIVARSGLALGALQIDQSLDQAGIVLNPSDKWAKPRKLFSVNVSLSVVGSMQNFQGLLKDKLESSNRVFNVESVDISPASDGNLNFRLSMKTYLYAIDPQGAPVPISPADDE
jgi:Tfp pilus assembly protein PilO